MTDSSAVVAAIAGEDPARLAALYGRYAASVYDYCRWLQPDPALAADAMREAFAAVASFAPPGPPFAVELRSPLYAAARNACDRPASATETRTDGADGEDTDSAELAEARRLARAVLADLDPLEQEVVELRFRHRLTAIEVADVLEIPPGQVPGLTESARRYLEEVLGALVLVRAGPPSCLGLASLLKGRSAPLTVSTGKLVSRHIGHCRECAQQRPGELRPDQLLGLLPLAELPDGLRELVPEPEATGQNQNQLASPDSSPPPGGSWRPGVSLRQGGIRANPAAATGVAAVMVCIAGAVTAIVMMASGTGATHALAAQANARPSSSSPAGGTLATARASQPSSPSSSRKSPAPSHKRARRSAPPVGASIVPLAAVPVNEAALEPSYPAVSKAPASPAPSASRSASPAPTHRRSPTPTPTPSSSPSPSASPSPSGSSSPSPTASPSASRT